MEGPIVVKISIQRGTKKAFRGKQTITERFAEQLGEQTTKEAAMRYFERLWDEAHGKNKPTLRLVKEL